VTGERSATALRRTRRSTPPPGSVLAPAPGTAVSRHSRRAFATTEVREPRVHESIVFSRTTLMVGLVTDSVEVTWLLDDITMRGTLTVPAGDGRFPAVVMVAGSGPTDRDWCSPLLPGTNGSARLLAEAFADAGIASLRYDKRASGPTWPRARASCSASSPCARTSMNSRRLWRPGRERKRRRRTYRGTRQQ